MKARWTWTDIAWVVSLGVMAGLWLGHLLVEGVSP